MPARARTLLLALALTTLALAGCLGDQDAGSTGAEDPAAVDPGPDWARPVPDTVEGLIQVTDRTEGMPTAYQLEVEGDIAYVAGWNSGFYTVDISTPERPRVLGHLDEPFGHDVDLLHYEDGRIVAALARSAEGLSLIDVTDPAQPVMLATILGQTGTSDVEGKNVHNIDALPGTHTLYNSRSVDTPGVDVVDASDPSQPEVVAEFGDLTCHDIDFWPAGERAYCAGIRETQIWDIADPHAPELVTRIVNPALGIHHWAKVTHNGSLLLIGDEFLGATGPQAQGCYTGVDNPITGGTTTAPAGAVWFYDISDEQAPVPLSYVAAPDPYTELPPDSCTAHFGEFVEDRDLLVLGFLNHGTYLVDFSDVQAPRIFGHVDNGDTPDVAVHNGYVFSTGRERGMDVLTFQGS